MANTRGSRATSAKVLGFIEDYVANFGNHPTLQEIAEGTGIASVSTVKYHLMKLENKGLIETSSGRSRGIRSLQGMKDAIERNTQARKDLTLAIDNLTRMIGASTAVIEGWAHEMDQEVEV